MDTQSIQPKIKCAEECLNPVCEYYPKNSIERVRCELFRSWCVQKKCEFTIWDAMANALGKKE